uniref:Uncharacterized protein n=1 Tax=Lactuca sativa TaxID=4236 RepID=A0A9R1VN90_LACSA|nr:hypothetical protein LSAT_V11C400165710 [Lactuca sativa]
MGFLIKKRCYGKVTSTSVPPSAWRPRFQTKILQLGNLKPFSFNVLTLATRNFRLDSVLVEGGSVLVFKGWIDEQSLIAAKPGTRTVIVVKRLNQEIFKVFKNGSYVLMHKTNSFSNILYLTQ